MKKSILTLLGAGLLLTSCQSDEPFAPGEGGEKQVTFTLNVPGELGTRAGATDNNSGVGGFSNGQGTLYYTLVLDANGDTRVFKDATVSNNGRTATFTPTVVLGRDYTITAYASFDDNTSINAKADIEAIEVSKNFNDESKDAYFHTTRHNFANDDLQPLTLRRPFGKLRLVATDYKAGGTALNTEIESVKVTYHDQQTATFNAVEGLFSYNGVNGDIEATKPFEGYYSSTADETTLFADYIPANSQDNMVDFTVEVKYANSEETYYRRFNDIPVRRNSLTTLKGNFFTAGAQITVNVDDNFDNETLIDDTVTVSTATQLQEALNKAIDKTMICFAADIEGDVTAIQKPNVNVIINGCGFNYKNGAIIVHSNSNHYPSASLTIKNVNFETSIVKKNNNNEDYFNCVEAVENGSQRYSTNITVENCTFTATGVAKRIAVGVQIKASKWAKVLNCTATNMHSLVQATSCDESVIVKGCTINGKNGVAFKQVKSAIVEGTTIVAAEYGIRFDGNVNNYGITVKDNNVTAVQPFIVRKMTGQNNTIALEGENTLTTDEVYQIVITNGSDDAAYVEPTGRYTLTGADDYNVFPMADDAEVKANSQAQLTNAIKAGATNIVLAEGTYVIPADAQRKTLTFVGTGNPEDVEVAVTKVGNGGENCDYGLDGSNVTFDGVTITTNSSTYIGYARCNGTYKNCVINGTYTLYGNSVFENCTFNVSGDVYNIWTWGAPNATFKNCTFNCDGKSMLLYGQANTKLTMNNCVFNDKGGLTELKAAIEIGNDYNTSYELIVNNATVNGFAINDKGINTGTTLWANKNSMGKDKLNVVVDGVDVY